MSSQMGNILNRKIGNFTIYMSIVVVLLMPLLCFSCSPQLCLQKRTNRLVDELLLSNDSIYAYSVAFYNYNLIWFHNSLCLI